MDIIMGKDFVFEYVPTFITDFGAWMKVGEWKNSLMKQKKEMQILLYS